MTSWMEWIKDDGLGLLKKVGLGIINLITFTLLYLAGRKSAQDKAEKDMLKQLLNYSDEVAKKREKTRKKFNDLRKKISPDWLGRSIPKRLRKNSQD